MLKAPSADAAKLRWTPWWKAPCASGDRVRITAQLIEASTDRHLWAEVTRGELHQCLGLQDEVARAIAQEIKAKLTRQEQVRLSDRAR